MAAVKFKEYSLWCIYVEIIAGIGSRMGLHSGPQPVSRNEVPYAVAKKREKYDDKAQPLWFHNSFKHLFCHIAYNIMSWKRA